jgi:hypothetical protein
MYSKQEASRLRQEFWTVFGQYMAPVPSAEGEKINWVNYKTGEKFVSFKMTTESRYATIAVELTHPDAGIQQLFFEQLSQLKPVLHQTLGEPWLWDMLQYDEFGKLKSTVTKTLEDTSVFDKSKWPVLISFFKPRIIALDQFWSEAKYAFELLH